MESNVNREIRNYHEGVLMGLSMRQAVCAALAAAIGAGGNFVLHPIIGSELASTVCVLLAAIPAAIGFVRYHDQPFERFALAWLRTNFKHNGWYVFKSVNLYSVMQNMSETLDKKERKNAKKNRRKDKKEGELNENREEEYAV